jgi:hypothetical protein
MAIEVTAAAAQEHKLLGLDPQQGFSASSVNGAEAAPRPLNWLQNHISRRKWPLVAMVAFTVVSMLYSLRWNPVVHGTQSWVIPGDIWSTFRAAHWVGWGDLGGVYGDGTHLVTFPGIAVLLAPVAMLSGTFGLSESIDPIFLSQPTAWLLLGPVMLLLGSSCLVALDAMAEALGARHSHRVALCWAECCVIFQVLAMWGHPEDLVALSLALYAILATLKGNWSLSGWLWGGAVVFQPLAVLMLPLCLSRIARGRRVKVCAIAVLPTCVLVGVPLLASWHTTSSVLLHQPNFPTVDFPTPWMALAPHLSRTTVAAGPGRMIAVGGAVGLGLYAAWRRPTALGLLWLCALALSLRCAFESVMVPFYLGPPLAAILLVAASLNSGRRLVGAWAVAMIATVLAFQHWSAWLYWTPIVALLASGLALAWPGQDAFRVTRTGQADSSGSMAGTTSEYLHTLPAIAPSPSVDEAKVTALAAPS